MRKRGCISPWKVLAVAGLLVSCAGDGDEKKVWGQYETYSCEDLKAERDRWDTHALSLREGEAREEYNRQENSLLALVGDLLGLRNSASLKDRIAGAERRSALMNKHMADKNC